MTPPRRITESLANNIPTWPACRRSSIYCRKKIPERRAPNRKTLSIIVSSRNSTTAATSIVSTRPRRDPKFSRLKRFEPLERFERSCDPCSARNCKRHQIGDKNKSILRHDPKIPTPKSKDERKAIIAPEAIPTASTYIVTLKCEGEALPDAHRAHLMAGFKPHRIGLSRTPGHTWQSNKVSRVVDMPLLPFSPLSLLPIPDSAFHFTLAKIRLGL
jgi:hypothetical protein